MIWIMALLDDSFSDLRYSLRGFRSRPGFAAIAILSLALGIGAITAIFSLIDAVMLKSLPAWIVPRSDGTAWFNQVNPRFFETMGAPLLLVAVHRR